MPALLLECVTADMGYGCTSVNKANWRLTLIPQKLLQSHQQGLLIPSSAQTPTNSVDGQCLAFTAHLQCTPKNTVCVALQPMRQRG